MKTSATSWTGTDGGAFDIDPKSGQLKVKDPLDHEKDPLDHESESKETYTLSVLARDPTRAGDTSMSTGTVDRHHHCQTDVNERPKVSGNFKPEFYVENSESLLVTTLTGIDEDEKDGPFHQNSSVSWLIRRLQWLGRSTSSTWAMTVITVISSFACLRISTTLRTEIETTSTTYRSLPTLVKYDRTYLQRKRHSNRWA